jgi:hypothetical protein
LSGIALPSWYPHYVRHKGHPKTSDFSKGAVVNVKRVVFNLFGVWDCTQASWVLDRHISMFSIWIRIIKLIIGMRLLSAAQLMIFPKTNKMVERYLNTNEIALEEAKELNEHTNKSIKFWLKMWQEWALAREYDVDIENYPILSCY